MMRRQSGKGRREFITAIGLGVGLGGIANWYRRRLAERDVRYVEDVLRRRLHERGFPEVDLRMFARDFIRVEQRREHSWSSPGRLQDEPPLARERRIVAAFLLATSAFNNRVVARYRTLRDPYSLPCGNPFARFEFGEA